MDLHLDGKTVIVTGGSGGIGTSIVLRFAEEGANVVIACLDGDAAARLEERLRSEGHGALAIETDVTDPARVAEATAAARKEFGSIEVLVNNAGGSSPTPFLDQDEGAAREVVDLNAWGAVNCIRAIGPGMIEAGGGSIVNILSDAALNSPLGVGLTHYAGAKSFLWAFTRSLAHEWGAHGVRLNCVSPGLILPKDLGEISPSSFWQSLGPELFGDLDTIDERIRRDEFPMLAGQPIRRIGRPEDVADTVVFLASDRASFLTGQILSVSGGNTMP
jgi:NAD(P)-dependent dehydrogenase (short-subunit alcohol dehydrogenase family)